MGLHQCFMRDGAAIPCICSKNDDHHEEEFEFDSSEADFEEVFDGDVDASLALGVVPLDEEQE